jgi:cell division protein FtsN
MTGRRRTTVNRRKGSSGLPAWFLLLGGILIGLGLAAFLALKGYFPEIQQNLAPTEDDQAAVDSEVLLGDDDVASAKPAKPRFDFFTVLPEMEVVVPEQELSREAGPTPAPGDDLERYSLQTGSFRNPRDAEQMKARLALLGSVATIHEVNINGETWHRVRIGPFEGARKTEQVRGLLADNGIDTLIIKANP